MTALTALPFRGIVTDRPYPPTGLTTARWADEVPTGWVRFDELYLTQRHIVIPALFGHSDHADSDRYPHVVEWSGARYLEDGHNRAVRAMLAGDDGMLMRIYCAAQPPAGPATHRPTRRGSRGTGRGRR